MSKEFDNVVVIQNIGAKNDSESKYFERRHLIESDLKQPSYWPKGLTLPSDYRKFYIASDLSYCGFAHNPK